MHREYAVLVERAATIRGDPAIPRDFISDALEQIESGTAEVERYPNGAPSLKDIYDLAVRLYFEASEA